MTTFKRTVCYKAFVGDTIFLSDAFFGKKRKVIIQISFSRSVSVLLIHNGDAIREAFFFEDDHSAVVYLTETHFVGVCYNV